MNDMSNTSNTSVKEIESILLEIYEHYNSILDPIDAIEYVSTQMRCCIFPLLMIYSHDAREYCKERDVKNIKIQGLLDVELQCLYNELCFDFAIEIVPMTSFTAGLNLIGTLSDVDIGVCIDGLHGNKQDDDVKLMKVTDKLIELGYKYKSVFVGTLTNRYISYEKYINGVEFEIKIRDLYNTQPLIELHKKLDNVLTDEQRHLYTYAKLLLRHRDCYKIIKLFIYIEQFTGIDGAFKLPAN
jgi:hypothetical protein